MASYYEITSRGALIKGREFNFSNLYLYHIYNSSEPNQQQIIDNVSSTAMGGLTVNNWTVYDGVASDATLVARGQGLHTYAGNWHCSFTLVFEDERFNGSTLEVKGIFEETHDWAIVGGTGEFAMASGVIKKTVYERTPEGTIIELMIRGFCPDF